MHASNAQSSLGIPTSKIKNLKDHLSCDDVPVHRPRSRSLKIGHEIGVEQAKYRMKHTVDYLSKGFKPNTRGDFIQDIFATLEDALRNTPKDIGFDMEISEYESSTRMYPALMFARISAHTRGSRGWNRSCFD